MEKKMEIEQKSWKISANIFQICIILIYRLKNINNPQAEKGKNQIFMSEQEWEQGRVGEWEITHAWLYQRQTSAKQ